mgnify:CR=1 FL=1
MTTINSLDTIEIMNLTDLLYGTIVKSKAYEDAVQRRNELIEKILKDIEEKDAYKTIKKIQEISWEEIRISVDIYHRVKKYIPSNSNKKDRVINVTDDVKLLDNIKQKLDQKIKRVVISREELETSIARRNKTMKYNKIPDDIIRCWTLWLNEYLIKRWDLE